MGKTKVTLDTNTLISALGWKGNPKRVLDKIVNGELELIFSEAQLAELSEVLGYPKFHFKEEQKEKLKALISQIATFVNPSEKIEIVKEDPDDNTILECAIAGKASFIITGDSDLLQLKKFRQVKIRTAKEFLEELTGHKSPP